MKKTKARKLNLNRETLRLMTEDMGAVRGYSGDGCSVPSCIDGCPTVFTCPNTIIKEIG